MKVTGLFALLFAFSFSAFAQTKSLPECGGTISLISDSSSYTGYSIALSGVQRCSNIQISGEGIQKKFQQNSYNKIPLSRFAVNELTSFKMPVIVSSNSMKTMDLVFFSAPTRTQAPQGPRFLQTLRLGECGGKMELYKQATGRLSLKFIGVDKCSNFIINQTQESYKLTDGQGDYQTRNFTLSNEASRYYKLNLTLRSNSGKTRFDFVLTNP